MKLRAKAWVIAVAVLILLGGIGWAAAVMLQPSKVCLEAINAEGRTMAYEQRAAALDGACVVIREMLAAYKARHGVYPDSLAGLVTVPEAICSRLPLNPYSLDEQLGMEADAASLPATVAYDPASPELVRVVKQNEIGGSRKSYTTLTEVNDVVK